MARFYIEYETSFRGRDVNNEALLIRPWPRKATIKIIGDMFIGKRTIYSRQRYLVNASFLSFFFSPILLPFLSTTCFLNQTALHLHQIGTNSCFLELGKLLYILTNLKKKNSFQSFRIFIIIVENWALQLFSNYFRKKDRFDRCHFFPTRSVFLFLNINININVILMISKLIEHVWYRNTWKKKWNRTREMKIFRNRKRNIKSGTLDGINIDI